MTDVEAETLLRAKQIEVQEIVAAWAKVNGLVQYSEQVRVNIKFLSQLFTIELTEEDWQTIFSLDLKEHEVRLLKMLQEKKNELVIVPDEFKIGDHRVESMQSYVARHSEQSRTPPQADGV